MLKSAPVSVAETTVTGALPVEVKVRDWVAGTFTSTLPNAMLAVSMLSAGWGVWTTDLKPPQPNTARETTQQDTMRETERKKLDLQIRALL